MSISDPAPTGNDAPRLAPTGNDAPRLAPTGSDSPRLAPADSGIPPLTPTGRVILGMITLGRRTGYEIKQFVDKTTRHFWAASYGQIYPELKRLEDQGLITGSPDPSGGRARTVFELTAAGRDALHGWLATEDLLASELRDEGMLKLFFSDSLPERRIDTIRAMRRQAERKLAQLETLEEMAARGATGPYLTLQLGLASTRCVIAWCQQAEKEVG